MTTATATQTLTFERTMASRYGGTCKITNREFDAGTVIGKTGDGWAIADDLTLAALSEMTDAPIALHKHLYLYDNYEEFEGWEIGDVVRAEWWEGRERRSDIVKIVTVSREYCSEAWNEDAGEPGRGASYAYSARARLATGDEATAILAEEADERARAQTRRARDDAKRALSERISPADVLNDGQRYSVPEHTRRFWITEAGYPARGHIYSLTYDVYELADGALVYVRDDADDDRTPTAWKLPADALETVIAASHQITGPEERGW